MGHKSLLLHPAQDTPDGPPNHQTAGLAPGQVDHGHGVQPIAVEMPSDYGTGAVLEEGEPHREYGQPQSASFIMRKRIGAPDGPVLPRESIMKETVWQFDALDLRPVARWLEARRPAAQPVTGTEGLRAAPTAPPTNGFPSVAFDLLDPLTVNDIYLETSDWRFHKAGLSLRIRDANGICEGSLESLDASGQKAPQRTEIQSPLPSADPLALLDVNTRLGEWVRALAGTRQPAVLFSLKSARQPYAILLDGRPIGEIVLDDTSIKHASGREAVRLRRVEVVLAKKSANILRPFMDDLCRACRLSPALASKFEAGLMTLDIKPETLPDIGPLAVSKAPSMGELAYVVLRRAFNAILLNEPRARVGEDIEALHDMRVAIRRMRASLLLFEPALPVRARTIRGELSWIARHLGDVRDLDIQLAWMGLWSGELAPQDRAYLDDLTDTLQKCRIQARTRMIRSLDSRRYARLANRLAATLQKGPSLRSRPARTPALAAFPGLIEERHASMVAIGRRLRPGSRPEAYHRLRIRCKRLRYAVENARELYGSAAAKYLDVLVKLQDVLGLHQDACVARAHLQELMESEGRRLSSSVVFMMGRAAQRYEQDAARMRKRLPKVYPQASGKTWIRLKGAMQKGSADLGSIKWPPSRAAAETAAPAQSGEIK
jgi:triphosphatase